MKSVQNIRCNAFLFSLALLLIGNFSSTSAQVKQKEKVVVFKGTADPKYNGEYVKLYANQPTFIRDSAKVVNGTFTFTEPFTIARDYYFYSNYEYRTTKNYTPVLIPVDRPAVISIAADMTNMDKSAVKGSEAFFVFDAFAKATDPAQEKLTDDLILKYGAAAFYNRNLDSKEEKRAEMLKEYNAGKLVYNALLLKEVTATVTKHPNSFGALLALHYNSNELPLADLEALYNKFKPALVDNYFGRKIRYEIEGQHTFGIGKQVPDFTLNDPQDQPLNIKSVKAKYLLIDFWGSWCGPCHTAFKGLRTLYADYHEKGFEILGIATDNKAAWIKDIEKEKLPWLQMLDKKGEENVALRKFAVTKYPTTILIDADGNMIGRDLSHEELEKLLSKL